MSNGPAQVTRKESADQLRAHYERIWQKGGEGWTTTLNLAATAWEREPELERETAELRERVGELEAALEQIANAWENMTYTERILGQPKASRLVGIADVALSSSATKQENQEEEQE